MNNVLSWLFINAFEGTKITGYCKFAKYFFAYHNSGKDAWNNNMQNEGQGRC